MNWPFEEESHNHIEHMLHSSGKGTHRAKPNTNVCAAYVWILFRVGYLDVNRVALFVDRVI